MAQEIERKFLVTGDFRSEAISSSRIIQAYLCLDPCKTVRVRIRDSKAYLTIKGNSTGISRYEWEKEIPLNEAKELLLLCDKNVIDKTRYLVPCGSHIFEVDEFYGDNEGLVLAEIELKSPDEEFSRPSWLGLEVSDDSRYFNSSLVTKPYTSW